MGTTQLRLLGLVAVSVALVVLSVIAPLPGVMQSSAAPVSGFTSTPSPTPQATKTFTPAPPTSTATVAPPTATATVAAPTATKTTAPANTAVPATSAPQQATSAPAQPTATSTPAPSTGSSSLPRTGLGLLGLAMGGGLVVVVATARRARTKA